MYHLRIITVCVSIFSASNQCGVWKPWELEPDGFLRILFLLVLETSVWCHQPSILPPALCISCIIYNQNLSYVRCPRWLQYVTLYISKLKTLFKQYTRHLTEVCRPLLCVISVKDEYFSSARYDNTRGSVPSAWYMSTSDVYWGGGGVRHTEFPEFSISHPG